MNDNKEGKYTITAVKKALRLLRLFSYDNSPKALAELSIALDMNKSAVFRLLSTLLDEEFVEKDAETSKYRLGPAVCTLGSSYFTSMNIRDIALPTLRKMADDTKLIAHFVIKNHDERLIVIDKIAPTNSSFAHNLPFLRDGELPIHCTGIGKIFLANMGQEKAREILARSELKSYTVSTVIDIDAIMEELPAIARQGYAVALNEHESYISSVGSLVRDYSGNLCAGISAGGISEMVNDLGLENLAKRVLAAAQEISAALGYREKHAAISNRFTAPTRS